jgi:hypothetical protein
MYKPSAFALALACFVFVAAQPSPAAPADRYLHVQVADASKSGENVNVNLPLSVAEKVLPTINRGPLHQGRVTVPNNALQGIDIRTIIDAVRTGPDSKIVTVNNKDENIAVEKSNNNIIVHVKDTKAHGDNVDVSVPISVVDALFSNTQKDEVDVAAALQALDNAGDTFLVTVVNAGEHVRVWVDSHSEPQ